nr:hypothetical protein [Tanacetum cinerariifolium]
VISSEEPHHHEELSHPDSHPEEHQSPTPDDSQPESSKSVKKKAKNYKEYEPSPDPFDSESSLASTSLKPYDNYMHVTERVLARNLQGFSAILYVQVPEDN